MSKERESIPQSARPAYETIAGLIDQFCEEHLNAEYDQLCRRLAAALARKRPSPITRGKPAVWACGIVYAIGSVNFLFDKSQTPHLRADELCRLFDVSPSSSSAKAAQIRKMFRMFQLDPRWTLPSMMDKNPLVWLLSVNGILMDIRYAPRGAQEEAYRLGLIPYIPGEPPNEGDE